MKSYSEELEMARCLAAPPEKQVCRPYQSTLKAHIFKTKHDIKYKLIFMISRKN